MTGIKRAFIILLASVAVMLLSPPAGAQDPGGLDNRQSGDLTVVRQAIFGGLRNGIGTIPTPTGGAFTYEFDPTTGVFSRTTDTLGPVFGDRAQTIGARKFTLSTNLTYHSYDDLDDVDLDNGDLAIVTAVSNASQTATRFGLQSVREQVTAEVYTLGVTYGVTDRIDVGLVLPIVRVRVSEQVTRIAFRDCFNGFTNCDPIVRQNLPQLPNNAENSGIGDLDARVKWNFLSLQDVMGGRLGMAASLNVKFPTGDSGDQRKFEQARLIVGPTGLVVDSTFELGDPPLGTGVFRFKPQVIASGSWFGFEPYVNVGFELGETTGVTNDFIYAVGVDYAPHPAITFVAGVIGRYALDVTRRKAFSASEASLNTATQSGVGSRQADTANPHIVNASVGMKANLFDTVVVVLNVLFPANSGNLRDELTPTVGVEWTF